MRYFWKEKFDLNFILKRLVEELSGNTLEMSTRNLSFYNDSFYFVGFSAQLGISFSATAANFLLIFALVQTRLHFSVKSLLINFSVASILGSGYMIVKCSLLLWNFANQHFFNLTRWECQLIELPFGFSMQAICGSHLLLAFERTYATVHHDTVEIRK